MTLESAKSVLKLLYHLLTRHDYDIISLKSEIKHLENQIQKRKKEVEMVKSIIKQYETAQNALD